MATLKQQIYSLADSDLWAVWDRVCDLYNFHEDRVYANDEEFLNEIWNPKPSEALRAAHFGDYNWSHEYVKFDGYGNLESSNDLMELIDDTQIEDCVNQYPEQFTEWFEFEESEEEE